MKRTIGLVGSLVGVAIVTWSFVSFASNIISNFENPQQLEPAWLDLALFAVGGLIMALSSWASRRAQRDELLPILSGPGLSVAAARPDLLTQAADALAELRKIVPIIEAELTAQERAVDALAEKAKQHEADAAKNAARAKLYEDAAETVRDLVSEVTQTGITELREQLKRMERKGRRDQISFFALGALVGALTNVFLG